MKTIDANKQGSKGYVKSVIDDKESDELKEEVKSGRRRTEKVIHESDKESDELQEYLKLVKNNDGSFKTDNTKISKEEAIQFTIISGIIFRAGTTIKTVYKNLSRAGKLG